jgi:hypothetical protein
MNHLDANCKHKDCTSRSNDIHLLSESLVLTSCVFIGLVAKTAKDDRSIRPCSPLRFNVFKEENIKPRYLTDQLNRGYSFEVQQSRLLHATQQA